MNVRLILFGGTSEGRILAEFLNDLKINFYVCVATEYGAQVMPELKYARVHTGRLEAEEMAALIDMEKPELVIDATHPYAVLATENIKNACKGTSAEYIRLSRDSAVCAHPGSVKWFDDNISAAKWLNNRNGNILLTTGFNEFPSYAENIGDKSRLYARVLLREDLFEIIEKYSLEKKQLICMQGPFSKELNRAMLRQVNASFIVTKESGREGGFAEKADAAYEAGVSCIAIKRPDQAREGISLSEIKDLLKERFSAENDEITDSAAAKYAEDTISTAGRNSSTGGASACAEPPAASGPVSDRDRIFDAFSDKRQIILLGIGMGDLGGMTRDGALACSECDIIIGASRMLRTLESFGKEMRIMYKSDEIFSFITGHEEYKKIVVALSGDPSFYSGAKGITEAFKDSGFSLKLLPGISSISFFSARLGIPWNDMAIVSLHGRDDNLIRAVQKNRYVFVLASYSDSVRNIAESLCTYGLGDVIMHTGCDLGYDNERIYSDKASRFKEFVAPGICCAVIENDKNISLRYAHGIPDEEFMRGKAPMTKREVRSICLSMLSPGIDDIVYDVGAGTGSVSVECARIAERGRVYSIENDPESIKLLEENKLRFGASNMEIIKGTAPQALDLLPAPDCAFIGGGGEAAVGSAETIFKKNPGARIVMTCVTLETLSLVTDMADRSADLKTDICCVNISRAQKAGRYRLMKAQNPVYVVLLCRADA